MGRGIDLAIRRQTDDARRPTTRFFWTVLVGASILGFSALASRSTFGQAPSIASRYMLSNQASKRNVGSASRFQGRIAVYHIFASDPHSSWSKTEKSEILDRLSQAYGFLNHQSGQHQQKIAFIEQICPDYRSERRLPTGTFVDPIWTERVIHEASGFESRDLIRRLKETHKADNALVCIHLNKSALSYNLAYYENVAEEFEAERMVCFSTYPDARPTSAATYAHEVLHLFGAGDLYFPYDKDDFRKQVAKRYFPNDVMFRVDYNLYRLNVGAFTAYRIGWRTRIDAAHKMFEDK